MLNQDINLNVKIFSILITCLQDIANGYYWEKSYVNIKS